MHSLSKTTSYDIDGKSDEGTWEMPEFINDSMNICSFLFKKQLSCCSEFDLRIFFHGWKSVHAYNISLGPSFKCIHQNRKNFLLGNSV